YEPKVGGFRAPLAANWAGQTAPLAVSLDAQGRVVIGAGTAITQVGLLCKPDAAKAGEPVDIMTSGEILEAGLAAGTVYYANATTGALETSAPAAGTNKFRVGHTVEASRLVVRCQVTQG
ncbi:MAG: hypothetical protein ACRD8U_19585, partial [Pyrinomonadaceae bacterium]